jgi:hypothetical protein
VRPQEVIKLKRIVTICALAMTAALAASSLATAGQKPDKPPKAKDAAAKQCAAEKKADKAAFKSLYGKHAMRTCVKGETPESASELKNAAKECKAAKADDPDGFAAMWGTGKNAYGKCVSGTVKAEDKADAKEFKNAAKECKAARHLDPDAFAEAWGGRKNALGKCVSATVKADADEV